MGIMSALMHMSLLTLAAVGYDDGVLRKETYDDGVLRKETVEAGNKTITYIDAEAMKCPTVNFAAPFHFTVYSSCRNHGLDSTVCAVNEISLWICGSMLAGGALYLFRVRHTIKTVKDRLSRDLEFGQSRAFSCAEDKEDSEMGRSEYPRLLSPQSLSPSDKRPMSSSEYLRSHCPHGPETGAFMHSRLGLLVHKHNELCANLEICQAELYYWQASGQILGLCNLVVPAVSIVMQGMLKVSANQHHADEGYYKDTDKTDYKDFDLDECARAFRQASVAFFTIAAIMLQSLGKIFRPDAQSGRLEEKISRIKKDKEQFEGSVSAAGRQDEHGKDRN